MKVYHPKRMPCGTHEPAASSTFLMRQDIQKKEASIPKIGVKNKSQKGNIYSSESLTCGTDLPAASSSFQSRQRIKRKKGKQPEIRGRIQQRKLLLFIEEDMWDRPASIVLIVLKAPGDQKKKANSQKLGVKNKSNKGKVYCSQRLTCGTHEPAASSISNAAQDRKKKASDQKSGGKKIQEKKLYCTQRMTCGSHEPAPYSTFQRRHEIKRKRKLTKYQEQKIIQEKKLLLYIEDDIWVPLIQALSLQDLAS